MVDMVMSLCDDVLQRKNTLWNKVTHSFVYIEF